MRQAGGTMLVACGLVHLDPSWINLLLRELLDHRLVDPEQAGWWKKELVDHCRRTRGSRYPDLIVMHKNFIRTGRLTKDYVRFLWREVPGLDSIQVFSRMISTMSTFGVMFQCDPGSPHEAEELMLPARLP
ncbi:unnamed protein product, partial [Sphacelaria rigidula]